MNQPHLSIDRLVLTGFMGSGKTTIGRLLSQHLGWRFLDLDTEIERRDGRTVAGIFAESGEPFFRALETETLRSSLLESSAVIALGGGAVETPANLELLKNSSRTLTILLTAPFEALYERAARQKLNPDAAVRPLLGNPESAANRLRRREALYGSAAGLVIDSAGQTPEETTEQITTTLSGAKSSK